MIGEPIQAKVVPDDRRCSDHPERPAHATCERCGRFVCGECLQAGAGLRCASCVRQLIAALPSGAALARWVVWLLFLNAGINVAATGLLLLGLSPELIDSLSLLALPVFIVTGILFLRWLHGAVRQGKMIDADVGVTPGWAVGYWFIPIVNLFRPYQIVSRLAAGVGAKLPSGVLGWWWGLWVISNLLGRAEARFDASLELSALSNVVTAATAILCATVVGAIQKGFASRRASFEAPARPSAPPAGAM